jgi:hypothetical protein
VGTTGDAFLPDGPLGSAGPGDPSPTETISLAPGSSRPGSLRIASLGLRSFVLGVSQAMTRLSKPTDANAAASVIALHVSRRMD